VRYWRVFEEGGARVVEFPILEHIQFSEPQANYQHEDFPLEIVSAGRGGGKGHNILFKKVNRGLAKAFERANDPTWSRPGALYQLNIFAPTSENYEDTIQKLRDYVPEIPGYAADGRPNFHWDQRAQRFELYGRNGFVIQLVSLYSPNNFRGRGGDDNFVDEIQSLNRSANDIRAHGSRMEDVLFSIVFPTIFRAGGYDGRCTLAGTPDYGGPFDQICDESESANPEAYFGNWKFYTWTSHDNPDMPAQIREQIERMKTRYPNKYKVEVLAQRHVEKDSAPDCPFTPELISCCLTRDRLALNDKVPPLVVFDLMYGGGDKLVRTVWNEQLCALVRMDIWTADELKMDKDNPFSAIKAKFEQTAAEYPGCKIAYDATGGPGSCVQGHIAPRIRLIPITRNNPEKNRHVGDCLERLANVNEAGRSIGIMIPDPSSIHLDATQRQNINEFLRDWKGYRKCVEVSRTGKIVVFYTKGEGCGDDTVDCVTIACSVLPAMRLRQKLNFNPTAGF
jgi:hypothetical protein